MQAKYLAGSVWSGLNAAVSIVVPLGVFVFFAREVPPARMGVVAYGMAWVEIIKVFAPTGLYEALLSAEDYDEAAGAASGLLMVSGLVGCAIFSAIMLCARFWMPGAALLAPLLLLLGARVFFDIVVVQPQASLARRLDFQRLAVRTLTANISAAVGGVILGRFVDPLTGFVAYYVLQSFVLWLMTVAGTRALARPSAAWGPLKRIGRNAYLSTQVRALGTFNNFADQIITAAFITPAAIALYNLGKKVEINQITATNSFTSILFQPLFARRQDDQLGRDFQRSLLVISLISGVPTALFVANATSLVPTIFGKQWTAAAPIAAALAVSGFARAIGGVPGAYFSVNGQNDVLRNRSLVSAITGMAIVCLTGVVGLLAMAWMLAVKNILITGWSAWHTRRLAGPVFYARDVLGVLIAGGVAAWLGRMGSQAVFSGHGIAGQLLIWTLSGVACVLGLACLYFHEIRRLAGGWLKLKLA